MEDSSADAADDVVGDLEIEEALEGADEGDLELSHDKATVSMEKNDRSLAELHRWYTKRHLIIDPEWQRNYVWDRKRASRLIESFMIGMPVPVIYLAVNDEDHFEVIDGAQRLTSVFNFFSNKKEYALTGLEILKELNGKTFGELTAEEQSRLEDTTLRTFELAKNTPKDIVFLVFERLNTGGVALSDMEIRNCLFRGKLNTLIKDLALMPEFVECLSQKGLSKRMKDRLLVLRFLAFYERTYTKARKGLKAFFNEFYLTYRDPSDAKIREFTEAFKKSIKASHTVFGNQAFRLRAKKGNASSEWAASVNASIFGVIAVSFTEYDTGALTRKADCIYEAYLDMVVADDQWFQSVRTSTSDYARIEYAFTTWQRRLKSIMETAVPNDSQRLFSRKLKQEMYDQVSSCAICGQRIALLNDAAMDHDLEYWRGGQTIPENARLVHRVCNLKRPRGT